jgi:hypothetical protein
VASKRRENAIIRHLAEATGISAVEAAIRKASRRRIDRDIRGHFDFTTEESRAVEAADAIAKTLGPGLHEPVLGPPVPPPLAIDESDARKIMLQQISGRRGGF